MTHRLPLSYRGLIAALLLLSACDGNEVQSTLGLNRTAPDEFAVVSRPALSLPPDFNLRPPIPGAPPRQATAEDTAHGILTGQAAEPKETVATLVEPSTPTAVTPVLRSDATSPAGEAFLKRAGAEHAQSDIRAQLQTDEATPIDTSKATSLLEQVTGEDKSEPVIDAKKEAERLRTNRDEGKPANEGDVPVEATKPPSVLDRVF